MLKSRFLHLVTILLISFQFLSCSGSGGNSTNPGGNNNSGGGSNGNNGGNTGANICGDGNIAGTEDCDDGNTASNDGCSSTCTDECRLYVKANAATNGTGLSWTNAFNTVQDAVIASVPNPNCTEKNIFIAKGIYYESLDLNSSTKLFGGFSGSEHAALARTLPDFNESYDSNNNTLNDLGINGTNFTILDGNNSNRIIASSSNTLIDGVVLQNGQGQNYVQGIGSTRSVGGAILINANELDSNLSMTIKNSLFRDNNASLGGAIYTLAKDISTNAVLNVNFDALGFHNNQANTGGAIYYQLSNLSGNNYTTINNSIFAHNTARDGNIEINGLISAGGAVAFNKYNIDENASSSLIFNHSTFTANTADYGGAISNTVSFGTRTAVNQVIINESIFSENVATNFGGAIYNVVNTFNSDSSTVVINKSLLTRNYASKGGAISILKYIPMYSNSSAYYHFAQTIINESILSANTSVNSGGAINLDGEGNSAGASLIIDNSLLVDNNATDFYGGAVFSSARPQNRDTPLVIFSNSTVANNNCGDGGGGYDGSNLLAINSIFWNNTNNNNNNRELTEAGLYKHTNSAPFNVSYSALQNLGTYFSNSHNINLTTSPFQLGSYELNPINGAACIDSGNNLSTYLQNICLDETIDTCVDLAGNNRIVNFKNFPQATVDMGAFEAQ